MIVPEVLSTQWNVDFSLTEIQLFNMFWIKLEAYLMHTI